MLKYEVILVPNPLSIAFLTQTAQRSEHGRVHRGRTLVVEFAKTTPGQNLNRNRRVSYSPVNLNTTSKFRRKIKKITDSISREDPIVMNHMLDIDDHVHHRIVEEHQGILFTDCRHLFILEFFLDIVVQTMIAVEDVIVLDHHMNDDWVQNDIIHLQMIADVVYHILLKTIDIKSTCRLYFVCKFSFSTNILGITCLAKRFHQLRSIFFTNKYPSFTRH